MCDHLYKTVLLKDSEQFVGIIKGAVFHSHSILDMGNFFDENPKYDQGVMECLFDGIDVRRLVFCNDDELFQIRDEIKKQNIPYLMDLYRNALKKEAETIIQIDIEEEDNEDDQDWWAD